MGIFSKVDNFLFGGPGEVGGVIGTPIDKAINYFEENPGKSLVVIAGTVATGGSLAGLAATAASTVATGGSLAGLAATAASTVATGGSLAGLAATAASTVAKSESLNAAELATKALTFASALYAVSDKFFSPKVASPAVGSIVYCELAGCVEHSGVYIDNDLIVHLNGDGEVESVSPEIFLSRLGGLNPAISIYISCDDGNPVGCKSVAKRAKSSIGNRRNYNFMVDNCHQFSFGCISGDFDNSCNFMWILKDEAKSHMGVNSWRVWDI